MNAQETLLWIHFDPIAIVEYASCPMTGIRPLRPKSVINPVIPSTMNEPAKRTMPRLSSPCRASAVAGEPGRLEDVLAEPGALACDRIPQCA